MNVLEIVTWTLASVGWMGDWATTVWPKEDMPEQNPFVRSLFGAYPKPLHFGVGKIIGLVFAMALYVFAKILIPATRPVPNTVLSVPTVLLIPLAIGVIGWHGCIHNLRLHLQTTE